MANLCLTFVFACNPPHPMRISNGAVATATTAAAAAANVADRAATAAAATAASDAAAPFDAATAAAVIAVAAAVITAAAAVSLLLLLVLPPCCCCCVAAALLVRCCRCSTGGVRAPRQEFRREAHTDHPSKGGTGRFVASWSGDERYRQRKGATEDGPKGERAPHRTHAPPPIQYMPRFGRCRPWKPARSRSAREGGGRLRHGK